MARLWLFGSTIFGYLRTDDGQWRWNPTETRTRPKRNKKETKKKKKNEPRRRTDLLLPPPIYVDHVVVDSLLLYRLRG